MPGIFDFLMIRLCPNLINTSHGQASKTFSMRTQRYHSTEDIYAVTPCKHEDLHKQNHEILILKYTFEAHKWPSVCTCQPYPFNVNNYRPQYLLFRGKCKWQLILDLPRLTGCRRIRAYNRARKSLLQPFCHLRSPFEDKFE